MFFIEYGAIVGWLFLAAIVAIGLGWYAVFMQMICHWYYCFVNEVEDPKAVVGNYERWLLEMLGAEWNPTSQKWMCKDYNTFPGPTVDNGGYYGRQREVCPTSVGFTWGFFYGPLLFIFGTALWLWPIFLPFILIATWAIVARKAARKRKLANTPEEA